MSVLFRLSVVVLGMVAATGKSVSARSYRLENEHLSRTIAVVDGHVQTLELANKRNGKVLTSTGGEEFRLRISSGVDSAAPDTLLTSNDFDVLNLTGASDAVVADLRQARLGIDVELRYTLAPERFYGHKQLTITASNPYTLELVDTESIPSSEAFAPYFAKDMMWTVRKFLPALGQPIYTTESATFWGVEFPAAWNRVEEDTIRCGVQGGIDLKPGAPYAAHRAVFGVGDDPKYVHDAFLVYIDQIRAAPATLKVQYNSWFDFGGGITQERLLKSLETLHQELVVKRGCRPLDVYTIDDGWQNSRPPRSPLADWSIGLYPVNERGFGQDLQAVRQAIEARGSKMGIWVSPACIFGARANIDVLQAAGFEVLAGGVNKKSGMQRKAMSMTGPKYMALLERRLLGLVDEGAVYFKLDGLFGDLTCRYFETLPGRGAPVMSRMLPVGTRADDPKLDDPQFDETKRYYLTTATQRLADIFDKMRRRNPEVRILCHNGATISPWWLMHVDVLSLVNSRDGAPGDRREQMCYRDALYYQLTRRDGNQVPLNSFFNHEPAKDANRFDDATVGGFRDYLFLALSRGTLTVELYFVVNSLDDAEYDVIADGLKWLHHIAPAFQRSHMHGGNPVGSESAEDPLSTKKLNLDETAEIYGYTGWTDSLGYISVHNPTASAQSYSVQLGRKLGLAEGSGPFRSTYVVGTDAKTGRRDWQFGETMTIQLPPRGVVVIDFECIK